MKTAILPLLVWQKNAVGNGLNLSPEQNGKTAHGCITRAGGAGALATNQKSG